MMAKSKQSDCKAVANSVRRGNQTLGPQKGNTDLWRKLPIPNGL